jgi:uncharacterized membrane protein
VVANTVIAVDVLAKGDMMTIISMLHISSTINQRTGMDITLLKYLLTQCVIFLQFTLEAMSVLCVFIGLLRTLYVMIVYRGSTLFSSRTRLSLGSGLAIALEFQLAADILATTVNPEMEELIKLSVIAVIRTFLNYFLSKELDAQPKENAGNEEKAS